MFIQVLEIFVKQKKIQKGLQSIGYNISHEGRNNYFT